MTTPTLSEKNRAGRATEPPLLSVQDLHTEIQTSRAAVHAVDGISFEVRAGRTLGLVGESGSGKSMTCFSLLKLLPTGGRVASGKMLFKGLDLAQVPAKKMRQFRGVEIALIPQDPLTALNPVLNIGTQVEAPLRAHGLAKGHRRERVLQLLGMVGLPGAVELLGRYPHQLSGGMRQRVVAAIALAGKPSLLLADEPTTSLDPTIQLQFLQLLRKLRDELSLGIIFVTHDLSILPVICDEVAVMYAGRIVERGPINDILHKPKHPYTQGLLASRPSMEQGKERLETIGGKPPQPGEVIDGCRFAPRCPHVMEKCRETYPPDFELEQQQVACWLMEADRD